MKTLKHSLGSSKRGSGGSDILGHRRKSNQYIADLRINNAKLATSLSNEKNKYSKIFQCYLGMQKQLSDKQRELRALATIATTGIQKFQSALDLMIEASALMCTVQQKAVNLCPELDPKQKCDFPSQSSAVSPLLDETSSRSTSISVSASNHRERVSFTRGSPGNSTAILGTARPMVQGQVISTHPTISLQRVSVPASSRQGTQHVPPGWGIGLAVQNNGPSRLSDISEELNESTLTGGESPPSIAVSLDTAALPPQQMPESHVLLERLRPEEREPSTPTVAYDDDDFTAVNFGSYSFCSPHVTRNRSSSPRKRLSSSPKKSSRFVESQEESSSEDESIAMQIVESKRSYLEPKRQLECQEGTSWNYDEAGKFHKDPPRKRNTKKSKSFHNKPLRDSSGTSSKVEPLDKSKISIVLRSPKISEISEIPASENVGASPTLPNDNSFTVCEEVDMSLTECMTSNIQNLQEHLKNANQDEVKDNVDESLVSTSNINEETRKVFVTKRSRRKTVIDSGFDIDQSFLSLNTSMNVDLSTVENNENSPPLQVACDDNHSHHNETVSRNKEMFSPQASFVVLERLPSKILLMNNISRTDLNSRDNVPLKHESVSPGGFSGKASGSEESRCSPVRYSTKCSPGSPSRKRAPSESQGSCEEKVTQIKRNRYKPGPKQFKEGKPTKHGVEPCISAPSAPSSPCSSRNDLSECESIESDDRKRRPRRNAAPVNLKEPKLTTKLRRQ